MLSRILRDGFNQNYWLQLPDDVAPQVATKPKVFRDHVFAEQFVRNLNVPVGYWLPIVMRYGNSHSYYDEAIEKQISQLLITSKLKFYPLTHLARGSQSRASLQQYPALENTLGGNYLLLPASILLVQPLHAVKTFTSELQAKELLTRFPLEKEKVNNLLVGSDIAGSLAEADSEKLLTVLSQALMEGRLVVAEISKCASPPKDSNAGESSAVGFGSRQPSLGPHESGEGNVASVSSVNSFKTQDAAARAALDEANPKSINDNLEYGGVIYRDVKTGEYGYTGPVKGTDQGVNPFSEPLPPNTEMVGDYHTHADYSAIDKKTGTAVKTGDPSKDDFNSDNFSRQDIQGITSDGKGVTGYKGYLGTPSGKFKIYDPATKQTTLLD